MSNRIASNVRLRRAVNSVVEKLEDRRLMAAQLPVTLDFDLDKGGILDKDGQGTGFTSIQAMNDGNQYQPSLIDLDTASGILKVTAKGTLAAGSNFDADSSLRNALQTNFDASVAGGFTMSVRLKGPLSNYTASNNQAGLMFGVDQDNYVKLVANNQSGGNYVQFIDETKTGTTYTHTMTIANSLYSVGTFSAITSLDLIMTGDPATGKISAFYRVNDGPMVKIGAELVLSGAKKAEFFSANAAAGLIVIKKSNNTPDFTATFDRFEITAGTPLINRPAVIDTRPGNLSTGVSPDAFVAADINLPTPGKGIDAATLTTDSVRLYRTSDHMLVTAVLNTDAAGGSIVLQPTENLDPNTSYTFEVTDLLKDTNGASFLPYTMSFTTGALQTQPDSSIAFEKISLTTAAGQKFTSVQVGPDGKLYATTDSGDIYRYAINADGTLGAAQVITTIKTSNGGPRLVTGIAFDPASTPSNVIAWVSHSDYAQHNATDFSGTITRLSGTNLSTYQNMVVNLPRSLGDHTSNQPTFGPDGKLYMQQGSKSAMGAPDNGWGLRPESMLSAAVLQMDTAALVARVDGGQGPLNVLTPDAGGAYDPYAANAALKLYATGVRNAYDMVWHSNGHLYVPTNGSAAGGALPATTTTPAYAKNNQTQDDWLFDVVPGAYYGHPNPSRGELVAHGANPTGAVDANEVSIYPVGTQPAANYTPPAFIFGKNYSPNGAIEYQSNNFNGALKGKLLVVRYSGGDDILILDVNEDGTIGASQSGIAGMTHFTDPLDIAENTANGFLYVAEYGGSRITLLRPITPGANINVNKETFYFNDVRGNGTAGPTQFVTITNTGTQALALTSDGLTIGGVNANQFTFVNKPGLPTTIAPGQSLRVGIAMNASTTGLKTATLTIKTNDPDQPTTVIDLRGIGTTGTGGANEPSLQAILNLYDLPINTGDANPANTDLYTATEPLGASDEVSGMERLVKADTGPITITPLAVMGVSSNPAVRFGYYEAGTIGVKTELFTVPTADAQTVNPTLNGITAFDPGAKSFGLYTTWPGFKAANGVDFRDATSEDALNASWDSASPHKYRFYQMKNADGTVVPNTYVVAVEEYNAGFDSNDIVFIISNVRAAPTGPEIGYENLDAVGFPNQLVFNTIGIKNATKPDITQEIATLRIRNTGSQDLVINGATVSAGWQVLNAPTAPIAAGGFYDLQVKFTSTSSPQTVQMGTLTIQSNDADEPTLNINLAGYYQSQSENGKEPTLEQVVKMFGYKTTITGPGQVLNRGGLIEAVGDEVLSAYWTRADSQAPVQVRQLAAFHTQGNTATVSWYTKGSTGTSTVFQHDGLEGQSLLPHKSGTSQATNAFGTFNTANVFGLKIDGERSDPAMNPQEVADGMHGHHVRFFAARDQAGNVIPNTYLMVMDYSGINYDYQDNIFLVTNIKPEAPAAVTGLTATGGGGGIALDWADNKPTNLAGYNVYRSTTSGGTYVKVNASVVTASDYNDTAAPAGATSYYRVVAVDVFGTESAVGTTVSALRTVDTVAPAQPTGVVAIGSTGGISLSWNANLDADLAGYNLYRSDAPDGTFVKINGSPLTGTTYADTMAPAGVASYYRVTAVDTSNNESAPGTASATRDIDTTAPATPTGVLATGSTTGVSLDWADNAETDLAGYNVYFSTSAGSGFVKLNGSPVVSSFFNHTGAPANVTSYYRVTAVDANGNESAFATANAVRLDGTPPAAPLGLTAIGSSTGIALDWANNAEADLAGYNVFRSDSAGGTYVKINAALLTGSDFVDTQAPAGATSHYYVVAVDASGNASAPSVGASAVRPNPTVGTTIRVNAGGGQYTDAQGLVWAAESGFTNFGTAYGTSTVTVAVNGTTDDELYSQRRWGNDFGYSANAANGDYQLKLYFVEPIMSATNRRRFDVTAEGVKVLTNFDIYAEAGRFNLLVKTFNVTITDGKLDLRFVSSIDNALISAIELTPIASTPTAPAAPTGLTATATSSTAISLAWTDNASNETGYLVERSTNGTTFTTVTTLGTGATSFGDTNLSPSTQYFYRVTALGSAANSSPSNVASATTQAAPVVPPAAPTNLVASAVSSTAINLTWADNATTESGYLVERSTDGGTTFTAVTTLAANTTSYGDTGLVASTQYFYRVTAIGTSVNSAPSNSANATTQAAPAPTPAAPTGLAATAASNTAINLAWTDNASNETGYLVERSTNSTTFTTVTTLAANATSYGDTGLSGSTQYFYRVTAVGSSANSAPSNVATATTLANPVVGTTIRDKASGTGFTDASGNTWTTGAGTWSASTPSTGAFAVNGTTDDRLFYERRWAADMTYSANVVNGNYTLKLYFVEPNAHVLGSRVFSVTAEGQPLLTNFDMLTEVGIQTALVKTFDVTVTDGQLNIRFFSSIENAVVSAIELIPTGTPTPVAAPTGLTATATGQSTVNLAWADNATNETGYRVERSTNGTTFTTVTTLAANATSYGDTGLAASTQYHYRVVALGASANSSPSNVATATTQAAPVVGTTIRHKAAGTGFTDASGNVWTTGTGTWSAGTVSTNALAVNGTTDDRLFYERRWGADMTYSANVVNGNYTLRLYFTETTYSQPNVRVFSVTAEGQPLLTNYDMYVDAGKLNAVVKSYDIAVTDGQLDVRFFSSVENAVISAIELVPRA